jgi:hypothetical protein
MLLLALFVTMPHGSARAAEYVVDQKHALASDDNPGTAERPWLTIAKAAQAVQPGDTVFVMEGKYPEAVKLVNSGAPGRKIVFKGVPRQAAEVQGFDTGAANNVRIEGFTIANTEDGVRVMSDDVEVVDNLFHHVTGYAIVGGQGPRDGYRTPARTYVAYNKMYYCCYGINAGGADWLIDSNDVERLVNQGQGDSDYSRFFGTGHVFRCNHYHGTSEVEKRQAHTDGWQFFSNNGEYAIHITLENNMVSDTGQGLMSSNVRRLEARDWTIRNNILCLRGWGANMLQLHGVADIKVLNNTFVDCRWFGVGMSSGGDGVLIKNNIFSGVRGDVYGTEQASGYKIERNLVTPEEDAAPGAETNVVAAPGFVDAAAMDFRLGPGSAAIGAGENGTDLGALSHLGVYYVDPRHPGATDEFWGYAAVPFATLKHACEVAGPGETILLRGGVHRGVLAPKQDNVTVRVMEGETAIVSGADLITGWQKDAAGWSAPLDAASRKVLKDGVPFTGLTFDQQARRIAVAGAEDPRLHVFETVAREHAVDLNGRKGVKVAGIGVTDTLADPVVLGEACEVVLAENAQVDRKALIGSGPSAVSIAKLAAEIPMPAPPAQ